MTAPHRSLLPIGDFARASLLTVKALRLYDQLGILTPAHIDPDSGYRYYRPEQLHAAGLIRAMRRMDLPLARIREVLAADPAAAEQFIRSHLEARQAELTRARKTLPNLLAALHEENDTPHLEVDVRKTGPQTIVSSTQHIPLAELDQRIRWTLAALYAHIERHCGQPAGSPFGIHYGPTDDETAGPIEICVPVIHPVPAAPEITARTLPAARVAFVALAGDQCVFPTVLNGYDAVYDWIEYHGFQPLDAPREIWLLGPDRWQERIEIAWPFRDPSSARNVL